jgi:ATP-dependent exoDNAse (exonuclease V) beta subunit
MYWLEKLDNNFNSHFILSPISESHSETENTITRYIKSKRSEKSAYEDNRIFYVACTRAKKRLILSANFDFAETGEIKAANKSAFISKIWDTVKSSIIVHQTKFHEEDHKQAEQEIRDSSIKALPLDWTWESNEHTRVDPGFRFDNSDFSFHDTWNEQNQDTAS